MRKFLSALSLVFALITGVFNPCVAQSQKFYDEWLAEQKRSHFVDRAPTQRVRPLLRSSLVITKEGFAPDVIHAYVGHDLELSLVALNLDKGCVFIKDYNFFEGVKKGEITLRQITLDRAGKFEISCPSFEHQGLLVVHESTALSKASERHEPPKAARGVASVKKTSARFPASLSGNNQGQGFAEPEPHYFHNRVGTSPREAASKDEWRPKDHVHEGL